MDSLGGKRLLVFVLHARVVLVGGPLLAVVVHTFHVVLLQVAHVVDAVVLPVLITVIVLVQVFFEAVFVLQVAL